MLKNMYSLFCAVAAFSCFHTAELIAQTTTETDTTTISADDLFEERLRLGAFIHGGFRNESTSFSQLPDVPSCCPQYKEGSGSGLILGIMGQVPFSPKTALQVRLSMQFVGTTLKAQEQKRTSINNVPTDAIIEHSIVADFTNLSLEPLFTYQATPAFSVAAGIGMSFTLANSFEQKETLVSPADAGTFENGSRTRNRIEGNISNLSSPFFSLLLGARYEVPLNAQKDLLLGAEAFYAFGLQSVLSGEQWNSNRLQIGLALMYRIPYERTAPTPIRPGEAIPLEK